MKASQSRAEPMNASPHHSKVKASVTLGNSMVVAGQFVSGKMEIECKGDTGLGLNVMMVELFAIQELTSRDHSATSTFIQSRRVFQGPGLPPSNAVQPYPVPGDPPLPPHYHQARRGVSTFLFRFPLPPSAPASVNLGSGLAAVRYEIKASVQVYWKGQRTLVTDKKPFQVVESFDENEERIEPEGIVVAENSKVWMQGKIVGGVIVAGESGCVELQVKNHSSKKNTGLYITLSRALQLPEGNNAPIQISDTLATIPFRGPEFIISPGSEGIASLVFDVPPFARTVHGGPRYAGESGREPIPALFEVKCFVGIKMTMGIGSKDIRLDIPVRVVHPLALPEIPFEFPYHTPLPPPLPPAPVQQQPFIPQPPPTSQGSPVYYDQGHNLVWFTPPPQEPAFPQPQQLEPQMFYLPPPAPITSAPGRSPSTAFPIPGLPIVSSMHDQSYEEGKGQRASRISQHLRYTSRNRSVSPRSHRFPMPHPPTPIPPPITTSVMYAPSPANAPISDPISMPKPHLPPSTSVLRSLSSDPGLSVVAGLPGPMSPPVLHSPRPMISPKQSFDNLKSENVQELERMAEKSESMTRLSPPSLLPPVPRLRSSSMGAIPSVHVDLSVSSPTLHSPRPVLSPKQSFDNLKSGDVEELERIADKLVDEDKSLPSTPFSETFLLADDPSPDQTPPTPTLAAITPHARCQRPQLATGGQGLDALERRLLEHVGTRKIDEEKEITRPDVRSVLQPISIPVRRSAVEEAVNESAISSFSLGAQLEPPPPLSPPPPPHAPPSPPGGFMFAEDDIDDDKTHYNPHRKNELGWEKRSTSSGGSGEKKHGSKKKEKSSKEHYHNKKLEVKGRVAAWLGALETPTSPPALASPPLISPVDTQTDEEEESAVEKPATKVENEQPKEMEQQDKKPPEEERTVEELLREEENIHGPPPPQLRSSGFVPVESFKRGTFHRAGITTRGMPTLLKQQLPPSTRRGNPVASEARRVAEIWASPHLPPTLAAVQELKKKEAAAAAKYELRSARGGRGGIVASVAAIWGNKDEGVNKTSQLSQLSPAMQKARPKRLGAQHVASSPSTSPSSAATPKPSSPTSVAAAAVGKSKPVRSPPTKPSPGTKPPPKLPVTSKPPPTRPSPLTKPPSLTKHGATNLKHAAPPLKVMRPPLAPKPSTGPLASLTSLSQSHATPMLSSTASLARPIVAARQKPVLEVDKSIPEEETTTTTISTPAKALGKPTTKTETTSVAKPEMAFGQARLRDLIRKYQQG